MFPGALHDEPVPRTGARSGLGGDDGFELLAWLSGHVGHSMRRP